MDIAFFTLLHILIFVYWLGGDLGVFYSSTILTDPNQSVAARGAAAKVLANVDMAPRTAMLLTLPTGATLASLRGWWPLDGAMLVGLWLAAASWIALIWFLHIAHQSKGSLWRRLDLCVRWIMIVGLSMVAVGVLPAGDPLPFFLNTKCAILVTTILCGLLIRRALEPFGPAFTAMMTDGPTPQNDAVIARCLDQSRPVVLVIWGLLLVAAFLGLHTPV